MRTRLASDADQPSWDDFVLSHPDGLAYHLYAWKKAVEQAYGFPGFYLLAEEQGKIRGVLPLIHIRRPLVGGGKLVSLPYCDVGGVLSDDAEVSSLLVARAEALAREMRLSGPELRQSRPLGNDLSHSCERPDKVRMILDLPGSAERLLDGMKAKLRSQVKKPLRDGLIVRLGGGELADDFYRVFAENMRILGSPVHSKKWIQAVVEEFAEAARVGVVYMPDGMPAAGGILLLHPRTVSIPWASSLRSFNHFNPNMLLYWKLLAFAADGGFGRFDFGRSTPGEGTYKFKAQWGATPSALCWQDLAAGSSKAGNHTTKGRRVAETIWSHLPLRVTTLLGPPLRRNISL